MKNIFLLLGLIAFAKARSQDLKIEHGACFITSGKATIVLNNMNFSNNGNALLDSSTLLFTGDEFNSLHTASTINRLVINKTNNTVKLKANITVASEVSMQNGLLDLSGSILYLANNAMVKGETETSRIIGTTGGTIELDKDLSFANKAHPGNLGLTITTLGSTGVVHIKRGYVAQKGNGLSNSINRYFDIQPASNTNLPVTIQLTYFNAELNGLNKLKLSVAESKNSGSSWIAEPTITANDNSLFTTGINGFYRYTLGIPTATEPSLQPFTINNASTGKLSVAAIKVWPVPAVAYVNCRVQGIAESTLQLYDVNGKLIRRLTVAENQIITLNNLTPGTYFIKVAGYDNLTQKVIIQ